MHQPNAPDGGAGGSPEIAITPAENGSTAAADSPYAKPNLVLQDPDPYAFANRIRRLVVVFGLLVLVAAGPYIVGQYAYQLRYGQMKAEVEVATEGLQKVKPQLDDFVLASRLVAKRVSPSVVSV